MPAKSKNVKHQPLAQNDIVKTCMHVCHSHKTQKSTNFHRKKQRVLKRIVMFTTAWKTNFAAACNSKINHSTTSRAIITCSISANQVGADSEFSASRANPLCVPRKRVLVWVDKRGDVSCQHHSQIIRCCPSRGRLNRRSYTTCQWCRDCSITYSVPLPLSGPIPFWGDRLIEMGMDLWQKGEKKFACDSSTHMKRRKLGSSDIWTNLITLMVRNPIIVSEVCIKLCPHWLVKNR